MLAAYFDDSGSHPNADIVLWGGVLGYPNQMDFLSEMWAKKLADPSPGKLPLERFHMSACQASDGEFTGWRRTETDYLVHELGGFILKSMVFGFAAVVDRKSYDELVQGPMRQVCGDAETFSLINCFRSVRKWAAEFTSDRSIALIFDNRPKKESDLQKIFATYKQDEEMNRAQPKFVSVSFASSRDFAPLQAADLIAWEFYQDALDTLAGRRIEDGFRRKQLERLVKGGRMRSEMLDREGIIKMMQTDVEPAMLEEMARLVGFR